MHAIKQTVIRSIFELRAYTHTHTQSGMLSGFFVRLADADEAGHKLMIGPEFVEKCVYVITLNNHVECKKKIYIRQGSHFVLKRALVASCQ